MSMTVKEIQEWLDGMRDDDRIGIDEDGCSLVLIGDPLGAYLEVGWIPVDNKGAS